MRESGSAEDGLAMLELEKPRNSAEFQRGLALNLLEAGVRSSKKRHWRMGMIQ
jgi:hypothetical protein